MRGVSEPIDLPAQPLVGLLQRPHPQRQLADLVGLVVDLVSLVLSELGVWGSRSRHTRLTSGDQRSLAVGDDRPRVAAAAVSDLFAGARVDLVAGTHGLV